MKTYEPYRGPSCPTGQHAEHDPEPGSTKINEVCDCPWLVVASTTPEPHVTTWSRRELERMIKEADEGYFDPAHLPPRHNESRFMSPSKARLFELFDAGDVLGAVQTLLAGIVFDQVVWDGQAKCLSLRVSRIGADAEWLNLFLSSERGQYTARGPAAGGDPDTIEGVWQEQPKGELLSAEVTRDLVDRVRDDRLRELVAGKLGTVKVDSTTVVGQGNLHFTGTVPPGPVADLIRGEGLAHVSLEQDGWVDEPLPGMPNLTADIIAPALQALKELGSETS